MAGTVFRNDGMYNQFCGKYFKQTSLVSKK